jgi:hypothetical protein
VQSVSLDPHVALQAPPEQTSPAEQDLPQTPQLTLSVWVLAQYGAPPSGVQSVWPDPHVALQAPPEQTWPAVQDCPHTPQLSLSVSVLAQ